MNKPDEHTLNRWLRGELEDEELREVDAWAEINAGDLDSEFQCNIGWDALGADYMKAIPASEEPPYPEFFNSKIQQSIQAAGPDQTPQSVPAQSQAVHSIWQKIRWIFMPTAIAAGIAFYAGSQMTQTATPDVGPELVSYERVYVPDSGVVAAFSETDRATEIVLEGLHPISDELDIVKGETSLGESPAMMVIFPKQESDMDLSTNPVTFF